MSGLFTRAVVLLVAVDVMYAGPVAACVCADGQVLQQISGHLHHGAGDPMASMPCCPGDPRDAEPSQGAWSDSGASAAACDPVPAKVLPASVHDFPKPIALAVVAWAWPAHGPPAIGSSIYLEPDQGPPIYLVTRRLRI